MAAVLPEGLAPSEMALLLAGDGVPVAVAVLSGGLAPSKTTSAQVGDEAPAEQEWHPAGVEW